MLDPSFDQDFLKTLASLKSKDPSIYDKNTKFFKNEESGDETDDENEENKIDKTKKKKTKPVTLKDYERKIILEKGGKFVDGKFLFQIKIKNNNKFIGLKRNSELFA